MTARYIGIAAALIIAGLCFSAQAEEKDTAKGLDMVSDTVAAAFSKANALISGNLDVTMSLDKPDTKEQSTTNALGQRVPKSTAIKSAGSLHNDEPL
ncbi:MAG: hypothetical protein NTY76_01345 [Candidatus Omnitrophica bacterium]|nr:hypothetical protein [Candidatus Omnitrophota bacterium]